MTCTQREGNLPQAFDESRWCVHLTVYDKMQVWVQAVSAEVTDLHVRKLVQGLEADAIGIATVGAPVQRVADCEHHSQNLVQSLS